MCTPTMCIGAAYTWGVQRTPAAPHSGEWVLAIGPTAMGGWLSKANADAAAPETPAQTKLAGSEPAHASTQLMTQLQGARHAPAARALPRVAGCRRAEFGRPARV